MHTAWCVCPSVPAAPSPRQVHESAVLGEVGKGYKYAIEVLNAGRIGIGAQMLGIAEGVLGHTIPYLQERKAFGQPVADFQVPVQCCRRGTPWAVQRCGRGTSICCAPRPCDIQWLP